MRLSYGVDVGGSGIKGGIVDLAAGKLVGKRHRVATPQPATPEAVAAVVAQVVAHHGWEGPVGCAVPAVVVEGLVMTANHIDSAWIGSDGRRLFAEAIGSPITLLNDADAAGLGEMRYGVGVGHDRQMVLMLTFGTGIGSALFTEGRLVPNTEFGQMRTGGMVAETLAAAKGDGG